MIIANPFPALSDLIPALQSGAVLTLGPRRGRHLVRDDNGDLVQHSAANQPEWIPDDPANPDAQGVFLREDEDAWWLEFISCQPNTLMNAHGAIVLWEPWELRCDQAIELLTARKGAQFQMDFQPTLGIPIEKVSKTEDEPVVAVLHQLRDLVERIVLTFEARFFT
jgi:hypothetical protein